MNPTPVLSDSLNQKAIGTKSNKKPMSAASKRFWAELEAYHDLAKQFEQHIQIEGAKGFYECELGWGGHCPYCATNAKYVNYRGPQI